MLTSLFHYCKDDQIEIQSSTCCVHNKMMPLLCPNLPAVRMLQMIARDISVITSSELILMYSSHYYFCNVYLCTAQSYTN